MTKLIGIMSVTRNLTGQEVVYLFPQLNKDKIIDVFDITHELGQSTVKHIEFLINYDDVQFQADNTSSDFADMQESMLVPQGIYANTYLNLTDEELESLKQSDLFK